jgi:formiminotetrahydrofolate cyclodeaminase
MRSMTDPIGRVADTTLGGFAEALASEQATPGGGSAAAVAATLAASLTAMVVRLSLGRPRYEQHAELHGEALAASDVARVRFLQLADEDIAAYATYRAARRMAHGSAAEEEARVVATRAAARQAALIPLTVVQECHQQIDLVERLTGRTNSHVASDLEVAVLLLEGAARGAAANVSVNLAAIEDAGYAGAVSVELDQRLQQIQSAADRTRERISKGVERKPEGA